MSALYKCAEEKELDVPANSHSSIVELWSGRWDGEGEKKTAVFGLECEPKIDDIEEVNLLKKLKNLNFWKKIEFSGNS